MSYEMKALVLTETGICAERLTGAKANSRDDIYPALRVKSFCEYHTGRQRERVRLCASYEYLWIRSFRVCSLMWLYMHRLFNHGALFVQAT